MKRTQFSVAAGAIFTATLLLAYPADSARHHTKSAAARTPLRGFVTPQGDTLVFEADTLELYSRGTYWASIDTPLFRNQVRLENGSTLVVDASTPAGKYKLESGETLVLNPTGGYPRYYDVIPRPNPALFFSLRTRARVAVLVDSADGTSLALEQAEHELLTRFGAYVNWIQPVNSCGRAFEFPRDWYRRTNIEFTPSAPGPMRITWVAYEIARVPTAAALSVQEAGGKAVSFKPALPWSDSRAPTADQLKQTARLLGEVVVYPAERRVVPVAR